MDMGPIILLIFVDAVHLSCQHTFQEFPYFTTHPDAFQKIVDELYSNGRLDENIELSDDPSKLLNGNFSFTEITASRDFSRFIQTVDSPVTNNDKAFSAYQHLQRTLMTTDLMKRALYYLEYFGHDKCNNAEDCLTFVQSYWFDEYSVDSFKKIEMKLFKLHTFFKGISLWRINTPFIDNFMGFPEKNDVGEINHWISLYERHRNNQLVITKKYPILSLENRQVGAKIMVKRSDSQVNMLKTYLLGTKIEFDLALFTLCDLLFSSTGYCHFHIMGVKFTMVLFHRKQKNFYLPEIHKIRSQV